MANPVLRLGEIAVDIDEMKFKIGDGHTEWNILPYIGDAAIFNGARIFTLTDTDKPSITFITNAEILNTEENKNGYYT